MGYFKQRRGRYNVTTTKISVRVRHGGRAGAAGADAQDQASVDLSLRAELEAALTRALGGLADVAALTTAGVGLLLQPTSVTLQALAPAAAGAGPFEVALRGNAGDKRLTDEGELVGLFSGAPESIEYAERQAEAQSSALLRCGEPGARPEFEPVNPASVPRGKVHRVRENSRAPLPADHPLHTGAETFVSPVEADEHGSLDPLLYGIINHRDWQLQATHGPDAVLRLQRQSSVLTSSSTPSKFILSEPAAAAVADEYARRLADAEARMVATAVDVRPLDVHLVVGSEAGGAVPPFSATVNFSVYRDVEVPVIPAPGDVDAGATADGDGDEEAGTGKQKKRASSSWLGGLLGGSSA